MLLFAHTGLTLGAAAAAAGLLSYRKKPEERLPSWWAELSSRLDIRWLMAGSLLPDIIDKPLGQFILYEYIGTGRAYAHTLVFLLAVSALGLAVWFKSRKTWGLALAFGTLAHHILDYLWVSPKVLLWPLHGLSFEPVEMARWWPAILETLVSVPWVFVPEAMGFVVILWFGLHLLKQRKVGDFFLHGAVA